MEPRPGEQAEWGGAGAANPRGSARSSTAVSGGLAAAVTSLRNSRGLGRPQLAALVGMSGSTLYRIETGERGASREMLERLADALEASPSERDALLTSAGYRPDDPTSLLEDPELSRFYAVLADPALTSEHRTTLLEYVGLALRHAQALGYVTEDGATAATNSARS